MRYAVQRHLALSPVSGRVLVHPTGNTVKRTDTPFALHLSHQVAPAARLASSANQDTQERSQLACSLGWWCRPNSAVTGLSLMTAGNRCKHHAVGISRTIFI